MYKTTIRLNHNEIPAKINLETGEVKPKKNNNIPEGYVLHAPGVPYDKIYTKSWRFLKTQLTQLEFSVAFELAMMAKAFTNSLEPLNDATTIPELVEKFQISKNKVRPVFQKLFKLGVYGKFEVYDRTKPYTKYWVLNPYLTFNGNVLSSDIARLFSGTDIALHFNNQL